MKNIYYNRYFILTGSDTDSTGNAIDQSSFKNCIIDFNQGMIDAGMIRTAIAGQLDLNNIPNVDYLNNTNSVAGYVYYTYSPLIYTFSDELNAAYPLYLKIKFQLINYATRTTAALNNKLNTLMLSAYVSISKYQDFSTEIGFQSLYYIFYTSQNASIITRHTYVNSEIVTGNVSLFNICPNVQVDVIGFNYIAPRSLMCFLIDRQSNGDVALIGSHTISPPTSSNSAASQIAYRPTYVGHIYSNGTTYYDTANNIFDSLSQVASLSPNQEIFLSASQYASVNKNVLNYNILNGNLNYFPSVTNEFKIKVKLPDGNYYWYKLIKFPQYPLSFYNQNGISSTRCIFIRVNEDG